VNGDGKFVAMLRSPITFWRAQHTNHLMKLIE